MATSAKAWVRKERARTCVALSALQVDLRSQQSSLDSNLVEAVQKELPSLVGISKSVGSTEDRLRQLCKELEVHRVAAAEYASGLHGRLREVELTFDERASLLQRSDEVNLLRRLAEALLNLESLLAPASSKPAATSAASSVDAMEATSRRLLREWRVRPTPAPSAPLAGFASGFAARSADGPRAPNAHRAALRRAWRGAGQQQQQQQQQRQQQQQPQDNKLRRQPSLRRAGAAACLSRGECGDGAHFVGACGVGLSSPAADAGTSGEWAGGDAGIAGGGAARLCAKRRLRSSRGCRRRGGRWGR